MKENRPVLVALANPSIMPNTELDAVTVAARLILAVKLLFMPHGDERYESLVRLY